MKKIIKKGITKRILSYVLILAMALSLIPSTAVKVEAATASSGYTTDQYGLMEYGPMGSNVYDFMGYINSGWKQVTFANNGFSVGVYNGSGLSITSEPSFIADGKAIMITYTIENTKTYPVSNYRFYIAADTMIDGNDASTNTIEDDVVVMTNPRTGVSFFALSSTEGGTAVATEYSDATVSYRAVMRGADPSTVTSVASADDSAFVMYFPKETISAGEQKQYTLVVGMGDARSIGNIIEQVKNSLNAALDYASETITDLTAGGTYEVRIEGDASGTVYTFIASQAGTIPLVGKDKNNKTYDFIGKKLIMVHKGNGEGTLDSDPVVVHVADRPVAIEPEVPMNTPSDIDVSDVVTSTNSIKVLAEEGQEYRIGTSGAWVSPGIDGYVKFTGLNGLTDYTIYTRVKATSSAPASVISGGVTVKTMGMFAPTKTEYNGPFDGLFHELKVNANVQGATVTYSQNLNGPYTSDTFSFKNSGEHKVYYCITKDNYYNAYGVLTANIAYNILAAKTAAKEIIDEELGSDTSAIVVAAANAAKAAIDAATTLAAVETETYKGVEAIIAARAAHVLAEEKAAAKAIINAEVAGDTSANVVAAANAAKAAIDAATTSAAVVSATANGVEKISAAKAANALAIAKAKAKADIDAEVAGDTSANVVAAANAAKAAIDAATTLEDVAKKTGDGIEAIIAAKKANALAKAKAKAKADIDAEVAGDTSEDVVAAANAAKAAIEAATTLEGVTEETIAGIENIATLKHENALAAVRAAAKDMIDAEVDGDTSENVVALANAANAAIDAATLENVISVTEAYIAAIRTAQEANALEIAKKAAKEIIDAEVAGDTSESVVAAANAAKAAIDAATTIEAVEEATYDGVEDVIAAKEANALAEAKKAAEAKIDSEIGADTAENVAELIRTSKEAINAATTLEDVARETARAMEAINALQEANALAEAKESAKAEIDAEVAGDMSANVIAAANAAKAEIEAATNHAEILAAIFKGVEEIEAAKAHNESTVLPDTEITTTTVPIADANEIINITPYVKGNAFGVVLDSANLKDAIKLEEFERDCGVWVWVEVKDVAPAVIPTDAQIIAKNVKDATVGAYINIELFKQVLGQEKTKVTETVEPIKLSVTVPDSIVDSNRVYAVVRIHDGEYEQITDFAEMKEGNVIEFTSDKFSTYAIIYKESTATDVPTGEANMTWAYILMLLSVAFTVGVTVYRKKNA